MSDESPKSLSPSEASAASPSPSSVSGSCSLDLYTYVGRAELYMDYAMNGASSHEGSLAGDGFVWADVGVLYVGKQVIGLVSHAMRLYQTNLAPAQNDVFTKYDPPDEADFSGYGTAAGGFSLQTSNTLDGNDWAYANTTIAPLGAHGDQIHDGGPVDNATIYGCFEKIQHDTAIGVIVGDWSDGGLTPATNPFPMDCLNDEVEFQITHAMGAPGASTSGNMVVTDIAERWFLHRAFGHVGGGSWVYVHLFTGAHTPGSGDTLGTYTAIEADFSGYTAQPAWNANSGYIETTVDGKAESDSDLNPHFEHNSGTDDDDVTGYFLTVYFPSIVEWHLIGGERFDDPVTMDADEEDIDIPMKDFLWDANQ